MMEGWVADRIRSFASDPDNITATLAMMKVAYEHGDTQDELAQKVIFEVLFRFHGLNPDGSEIPKKVR